MATCGVRMVVSCLPPPQCLQSGDGAIPPEHMQAYKAETGPCLQSEYKIRSDAYASVFRMGSLSVPSEKRPLYILPTHPLAVANRPHPLQCWWLWNAVLKPEGNDFSHRETCPQLGSAGNQHCIDWGCGGPVRRAWMGTVFRSGRTRVRWCCTAIVMCAVWSMDAGKSYRWARHARSKKQAKTTCRGLASP